MTTRPGLVYNSDGHLRDFGTGGAQSIFPFWMAATAPAMLYLFVSLDSQA